MATLEVLTALALKIAYDNVDRSIFPDDGSSGRILNVDALPPENMELLSVGQKCCL